MDAVGGHRPGDDPERRLRLSADHTVAHHVAHGEQLERRGRLSPLMLCVDHATM